MTIREFCNRYKNGDFASEDINVQIEAGWDDWFCTSDELPKRLKEIYKILEGITNDAVLDHYRVEFENCFPMDGNFYDWVRFYSLNNGPDFGVYMDCPYYHSDYMIENFANGMKVAFDEIDDVWNCINELGESL